MKTIWAVIAICLLTGIASGEELISKFARDSLNLDLTACPFGAELKTHSAFVNAGKIGQSMHDNDGISWYTNSISAVYDGKFPGRSLKYGFRGEKLAAIEIFINAMDLRNEENHEEKHKLKQAALDKIRDDIRKLGGKNKLKFDDGRLRIEYNGYCSPAENFFAVILIAPVNKTP